jgi:hypothetical protein
MVSLWRDLIEYKYQLSIPYVARNIRIDSSLLQTTGEPIQERVFPYKSEIEGAAP